MGIIKCYASCFLERSRYVVITVMALQGPWPQTLTATAVWSCWCLMVKVQRSRFPSTESTRWVCVSQRPPPPDQLFDLNFPCLSYSGPRLRARPTPGCESFPGPSSVLLPEGPRWWCTPRRVAHTHGSSTVAQATFVRWSPLHTLASVRFPFSGWTVAGIKHLSPNVSRQELQLKLI